MAHSSAIGGDKVWSKLKVDAGWEDAVEAVLRIASTPRRWHRWMPPLPPPVPPARMTVFATQADAASATGQDGFCWPTRADDAAIATAVAHWLHGVRVTRPIGDALAGGRNWALASAWSVVTVTWSRQ